MPGSESAIRQILKTYWNYDAFRDKQEEIILSVMSGRDTLALLPTGGGKSICFQVPALAMGGICLVISPLVALMKDQVGRLKTIGLEAVNLSGGLSSRQIDIALDNCIYGNVRFLYTSPERLASSLLRERIRQMKVSLVAVDEAHCISQWGHDFRPSYLQIASVRELCPESPVLALTASASPAVQEDIQQLLAFRSTNVISRSFLRENLSYQFVEAESRDEKIMETIASSPGASIVYVRTRRQATDFQQTLHARGFKAALYHAGMRTAERDKSQQDWLEGRKPVIVATNAFGMGIDKANVRLVIHLRAPASPEAYYQEAGRAGRDGLPSRAVLFWTEADLAEDRKQTMLAFPSMDDIRLVFQSLANYFQVAAGTGSGESFGFDLAHFCARYKFKASLAFNCLRVLERNRIVALSDAVLAPSTVRLLDRYAEWNDLSRFSDSRAALLQCLLRNYEGLFVHQVRIRESEIARLVGVDESTVLADLSTLAAQGVLDYRERSDLPMLSYTEDRVHTKDLYIDRAAMARMRDLDMEKLSFMAALLHDTQTCRNRRLLEWFGEKLENDCGICDNCSRRRFIAGQQISLAELILSQLGQEKVPVKSLLQKLPDYSPKEITAEIRNLAARGLVNLSAMAEVSLS